MTATVVASRKAVTFFSNVASGATSTPVALKAGRYMFKASGTFGSANVDLQYLVSGSTYADLLQAHDITALNQTIIEIPDGTYKAVLTGSGASAIYVSLEPVQQW